MGLGYLKVQVHTGDDALPIEGARVLIKEITGRVLYDLVTDASGNTQKVELYAPDKYHTLDPNDTGPFYSTYDVEVMLPQKFTTEIIHDVHIYDTVESILPVNLLPLPQEPTELVDIINIPPPAVQLPIRRQQAEPPSSPFALREVVIPDYITVHLAAPTVSARNVRVKFPDYIKNVASSEIYPTWPQASLESNIYAQISFALNRVFTEWYRSRGFEFDITNSTAVDQAFVEGREIFANISLIVDRIFNSFIRRPGRLEPFFAQFCNGTTSTCPGLSQWGTVTLANQGRTPLEILRHYYPSDVVIATSNNITGITESYPGTPLRESSSGEHVRLMQRYLNRIRVNYPLIPQIANPNGVFAADTTKAVQTFQNIFNLTPDGIIGRATWNKIVQLFVGITKLASLDSEGERIGIGAAPPTIVLREGSTGPYVLELQFLLNYIGVFYSTIPPVIQDNVFRSTTTTSVRAFQNTFGLTADGIVGPTTWNMLYNVFKGIEDNVEVPEVPPTAPVPPGHIVHIVESGDTLYLLAQRFGTTVDEIMRINNLTSTVLNIGQELLIPAPSTPQPPTLPTPPFPGVLLRVGSRGSDVVLMQQALNIISDVHTSIPKLVEDGIFGSITRNAVAEFQRIFRLTADGIIGPITWNRIITERNNILSA